MIKEYIAYLKDNPRGYWFKAKWYGWGWVPARWQGWLTLSVFIGLIILNSYRIDYDSHSANDTLINFIPQTFFLFAILLFICWKKGERPRWSWGPPEKYIETGSERVFYARFGKILQVATAIAISGLAGVIGLSFTTPSISSGWYANLVKPEFAPPNWVFGPAWTTLYFLIGISLFLVWKNKWETTNRILESKQKGWNKWSERLWTGDLQKANVIAIFAVQYVLNILWSFVFFGWRLPSLAFLVILALWFAIIFTIINFYRISKLAAYLLVPYILWVSFAGYLNYSIWQLNPLVSQAPQASVCTQDAKLCSDGSYVSRVQPKCDFALCLKENLIIIESPEANEKISSPVFIKGLARGTWFFEATFPIKLYGEAGELITQSYATAQSEWMTTDFVPFEANLEFTTGKEQAGILVLEKDNPSGLPEHSDEIRVPVVLK